MIALHGNETSFRGVRLFGLVLARMLMLIAQDLPHGQQTWHGCFYTGACPVRSRHMQICGSTSKAGMQAQRRTEPPNRFIPRSRYPAACHVHMPFLDAELCPGLTSTPESLDPLTTHHVLRTAITSQHNWVCKRAAQKPPHASTEDKETHLGFLGSIADCVEL